MRPEYPLKTLAFTTVLFVVLAAWVGFWYVAGHSVVTPRGQLPTQAVMDRMAPTPSPYR